MGKDAGELREEIGETRDRMGDTVDAIAYKSDVRARLGDRIEAVKSSVRGTVSKMTPDMDEMQDRARSAAGVVRENPLGLFFGMAAAGFLIGSLLPGTSIERQRLGPIGDQLKGQAQEKVQDAIGAAREAAAQAVNQVVTGTTGGTPTV